MQWTQAADRLFENIWTQQTFVGSVETFHKCFKQCIEPYKTHTLFTAKMFKNSGVSIKVIVRSIYTMLIHIFIKPFFFCSLSVHSICRIKQLLSHSIITRSHFLSPTHLVFGLKCVAFPLIVQTHPPPLAPFAVLVCKLNRSIWTHESFVANLKLNTSHWFIYEFRVTPQSVRFLHDHPSHSKSTGLSFVPILKCISYYRNRQMIGSDACKQKKTTKMRTCWRLCVEMNVILLMRIL